jgi:Fe-S-cluster containining protein
LHAFAHESPENVRLFDQFCNPSYILELTRVPVRCLSLHAPYVCAHAGECCRAGWPIPVEEHLVAPLRVIGIDIPPNRVAPSRPDGACAFFESDNGGLCTIHRVGGSALLPSVCRHFPRVVVKDPRGTSVTLSHFCPTAANLLFARVPLAIVDAPAALSLGGALDGLDATTVLPPLLSKSVLMDWDGYSAWEEAAIELFNDGGIEPEHAVRLLLTITERICGWTPGREPLSAAVRREFAEARDGSPRSDRWGEYARPLNAFLAAHAFASWAAYEADGLRAVVGAVELALRRVSEKIEERGALTRSSLVDAIRDTDLELRHRA